MDILNWSIQTSPPGKHPVIVSEYLLNELGVFIKREQHMPKSAPLTALTGFRIGYAAIPGTDYRAAPMDRSAILWHKIASVDDSGENSLTVSGNRSDAITVFFPPELKRNVAEYIAVMRRRHPPVAAADPAAASWICWRDDDEWENPFAPLVDMVRAETGSNRFLEPEVLDETVLTVISNDPAAPAGSTRASSGEAVRPKFCTSCGAPIPLGGSFCGNCGTRIPL